MEIRGKVSSSTGRAVAVLASLLLLWVGSDARISDALGRAWMNVSSTRDAGVPGSEAFGLRRQLVGESYGAGRADLEKRRFLARQGQVLVLDYDVAVGGGFLHLSVDRVPFFADALWGRRLDADRRDTLRLPIRKTGIYQLTVTQYRHTGTYTLGWYLENP